MTEKEEASSPDKGEKDVSGDEEKTSSDEKTKNIEGEKVAFTATRRYDDSVNLFKEHFEEPPELDMSTHWSVPWADLMMVMFIMFAVLYAYQVAERDISEAFQDEAREQKAVTTRQDISKTTYLATPVDIYESSEEAIRKSNLENVDVVLQEDMSVKISVRGPMFFDVGKADLKPETKAFLNRVADVLWKNNREIHVAGHTDNFPMRSEEFPTNWELSAARATKVVRYLVKQGIEPGRFTVIANSKYRPEVPNTTKKNKARNRRVEIIITPDEYIDLNY